MYESGEWRIRRTWRFGGIIVDGNKVELVTIAKQNPLVARRDRE